MTTSQILLYGLLVLVIFVYLRRFLQTRSITRYSPVQLAERMKETGWVLLDVRTAGERQAQQIRGSIHIPLQELQKRVKELDKYKEREIICYCQSGSRSLAAAARLRKQGFNVANLEGGISEWNFTQR